MRLSATITQEVEVFTQPGRTKSGSSHDHYKIINKVYRHQRGEFESGVGSEYTFWPLGRPRAPQFSKKLELDFKNFRMIGQGEYNLYGAWAMNIQLRRWARESAFGLLIDDVADNVADFGSAIYKFVEQGDGSFNMEVVDLRMIYFDTFKPTIHNNTKIEKHELEAHVILGMKGWDNKKEALKMAARVDGQTPGASTSGVNQVDDVVTKRIFWEREGWYDMSQYDSSMKFIGNEEESNPEADWQYWRTISCGDGEAEVIVFQELIDPADSNYMDVHLSKYVDCWLRVGVYQRLFGLQKLANEIVNDNSQAQRIAALLLFKTSENNYVGSNILASAKSGLVTDADIEQIGISMPQFNAFITNLREYEAKADQECMTPDVLKGVGAGGVKTFRGQAALISEATSAFKKSHQRIGYALKMGLYRKILPQKIAAWSREKSVEIAEHEGDIQMYDITMVRVSLNEYIQEQFAKGNNPSEQEKVVFVENSLSKIQSSNRIMKLNKAMFNTDYGMLIDPVGEVKDLERMNGVYSDIMKFLAENPAVGNMPYFKQYVENNGIPAVKITEWEMKQIAEQQQQMQVGGGNAPQQIGERTNTVNESIQK